MSAPLRLHATPRHSCAVGCGRRVVPAARGAGARTAGLLAYAAWSHANREVRNPRPASAASQRKDTTKQKPL